MVLWDLSITELKWKIHFRSMSLFTVRPDSSRVTLYLWKIGNVTPIMPLNTRKVMEKRETRYMKICSWIAANHFIPSCSTIASPVRYTLPVTPCRRRSRGREGNDNESKLMEFPRGHTGLRRSSGSNRLGDYGGKRTTGWLSRFRRRSLPSAKGLRLSVLVQPPWASCGTPRLSTNRLRLLATPDRAISRLAVYRREPDQRRRVLASLPTSGHPCSREQRPGTASHRSRVYVAHLRRR